MHSGLALAGTCSCYTKTSAVIRGCAIYLLLWMGWGRKVLRVGERHPVCRWNAPQSEGPKSLNMEFLKSLVPAAISGEGSAEQFGALSRETGPRLLSIKRLGLLVMGQTIEEDPVDHVAAGVDPGLPMSRSSRRNQSPQKGRTNWTTVYCITNLFVVFFISSTFCRSVPRLLSWSHNCVLVALCSWQTSVLLHLVELRLGCQQNLLMTQQVSYAFF